MLNALIKSWFQAIRVQSLHRSSANLLTMSESVKKVKKLIGTHSGPFHCDDVLACFLIRQLDQYKDAEIIRTRNENLLQDCDIVVDVGGVYDHEKHRYDHHQSEFTHTMQSLSLKMPYNIRLSSAGLIYHHFGHQIISSLLNVNINSEIVEIVFDKIYKGFIQEIDAIDNGIAMCSDKPLYHITTHISSRVANLLPTWLEGSSEKILLDRFYQAMDLVGHEFKDRVNFYGNIWYKARQYVKQSIENRFNVDKSGQIIDLSQFSLGLPWKEHLDDLEKQLNIRDEIKFVIWKDASDVWRVQAVPIEPKSFILKVPLEQSWQGLRDDTLSKVAGIDGCIFVHSTGFNGANKTRSGALQMAKRTLELAQLNNGN